jgi:hypothetical protein
MVEHIEHMAQFYRDAFNDNFDRWPVLGNYVRPNPRAVANINSFEGQVAYLTTWLYRRMVWLDTQYTPPRTVGAPDWKLIPDADLTLGTFVASYDASEYGLTEFRRNPNADNTQLIQSLIDATFRAGGGTVYIPAGKYRVNGTLLMRKGVTLRGDWVTPIKGQPVDPAKNTVLMAYHGRNNISHVDSSSHHLPAGTTLHSLHHFYYTGHNQDVPTENRGFITMEPLSCVANVVIWYPEQDPENIVPYTAAIMVGSPRYFGNEYANVRNVTMVNPYVAFQFDYVKGGGAPVINGFYGTPLHKGVEIDGLVEIGRLDNIAHAHDRGQGHRRAKICFRQRHGHCGAAH